METGDKRQELQGILMEMETHKRQMEAIKNEIQVLDATMAELGGSLAALDGLSENKAGAEILVSLGSGSFMRAELKDSEKVIVGAGAGISIEKNVDEAKGILKARGDEIAGTMEKLQKGAVEINDRLMKLNEMSQAMMREMQGGQMQGQG